MPPDTDKLRHRTTRRVITEDSSENSALHEHFNSNSTSGNISNDDPAEERLCSLKSIKTTEVCIDGYIYDLESFHHPGGESIKIFGGNDATIQYKMNHPYHTKKHLQKMKRTGRVIDYVAEYKFDTEFERELKREVFKVVRRGKEFGTPGFMFRVIMYLALYAYCQYLWLTQGSSWKLAMVYAFAQAMVGLNIQHDANHGAVSKKYLFLNDILGLGTDLAGGDKWLWMEQHAMHHAYTNHSEKDPDSLSAEPIFIWNDYAPDDPRRKWHHKFQGIFYIFVLSLYWFTAVFNPEVFDLRQRGAQGVGFQMESDFVKKRRKFAVLMRLYYIYVHAVYPFQFHGLSWRPVVDILTLAFTESLILAMLFSLSHNFEESDRNPTEESKRDSEGKVCWFKAQAEAASTYGGSISGWLTGGLNFQIEHHMFPRMNSAWYPYISPKVREVCAKHGVKYTYYPWIWQNMWSTLKYMHRTGTGAHWRDGNPYSGKL